MTARVASPFYRGISSSLSSELRIVAAGKGRTMSHPKMVETVLDLVPPRQDEEDNHRPPKVVFLGTASFDDEQRMLKQIQGFRDYDCEVVPLRVSHRAISDDPTTLPSYQEMNSTLHSADIIQVSGGNTLYALQRWRELGLDTLLYQAATSGVVLCGGSAGAVCWFDQGHSDSMNPVTTLNAPDPSQLTDEEKMDWDYIRVDGLGFIPGLCVPHHDTTTHIDDGLPRSEHSEQMLAEKPEQPGIGIDEGAALVVDGNEVRVVSTDGEASCHLKQCLSGKGTSAADSSTLEDPTSVVCDIVSRPVTEEHGPISLEDFYSGNF